MASGESKGSRRYDKENLLWQFTVAIKSAPVGPRIEIMNKPGMVDSEKDLSRTGYAHIAFSLGSRELVDELTKRMESAGYTVVSGPRTTGDGCYESCIFAVEGNQIELTI